MNSTIATIQSNRNYEKVLELLNQIAPNNDAIQEQISTLTTSKSSYIKQLQKKWNSITPPKYTELDIRVLCTNFYNLKEEDNEKYIQFHKKCNVQLLCMLICNAKTCLFFYSYFYFPN